MPAHVYGDAVLTVTDLVIDQFDHWSNPDEPILNSQSIIWCFQDPETEFGL